MRIPEEFVDFCATISHCSWDDAHHRSLICSDERIADFDAVKDEYAEQLNIAHKKSCSADAIFLDGEGEYVLVEFKSGRVDPKGVIRKIYDSALILADRENVSISWLREHVRFVLVYPKSGITDDDRNDFARRHLMKQTSQDASREVRMFIPENIIGFFYKDAIEMTPDRFIQTFL